MKVTVKDTKSGRERTIPKKQADVLVKLGRATYLTRDMVAAPAPSSPETKGGAPRKRGGRKAQVSA